MYGMVSKRMRGKNGFNMAFGMRITKKNVLWFGLAWLMWQMIYWIMWLTVWAFMLIVIAFFVWPFQKIRNAIKGRDNAETLDS